MPSWTDYYHNKASLAVWRINVPYPFQSIILPSREFSNHGIKKDQRRWQCIKKKYSYKHDDSISLYRVSCSVLCCCHLFSCCYFSVGVMLYTNKIAAILKIKRCSKKYTQIQNQLKNSLRMRRQSSKADSSLIMWSDFARFDIRAEHIPIVFANKRTVSIE